jgi:hypothetical protein
MNVRQAMAVFACAALTACGGTDTTPTATSNPATQSGQQGSSGGSTPAFLVASTPAGTASTPCPAIGFDDVGAPGAAVASYAR